MATVILRGPAIVKLGSLTIYTKDGIRCTPEDESASIANDFGGDNLDQRFGGRLWKISFTPCGEMESAALYWPFQTANVGDSVVGAGSTSCIIHTKSGDIFTFTAAGIGQMPSLALGPRKQPFGPMEIVALGNPAKTTGSFADTAHDFSKIYTGRYTAALGSRSSPYNAIEAADGFEFIPRMTYDKVVVDRGVGGLILTSVSAEVRFRPSNLTHAEYEELTAHAPADPIAVGESYAVAAENLVITGDHCVVTLYQAGAMRSEYGFGLKLDRLGNLTFMGQAKTTTGVFGARFDVTFS